LFGHLAASGAVCNANDYALKVVRFSPTGQRQARSSPASRPDPAFAISLPYGRLDDRMGAELPSAGFRKRLLLGPDERPLSD